VKVALRVSAGLAAIAAVAALGLVVGAAASAAPANVAGWHRPVPAAMIRPDNSPCGCNRPVVEPENNLSQYGWISRRTGVLMTDGSNDTEFWFRSNNELEIFSGKYSGDCLYYDHDAADFDVKRCDAAKLSDLWKFGDASHPYSEWQSLSGHGDCVWYKGKDHKMRPEACDGTKGADHWYWVVPTCQPYCTSVAALERAEPSSFS
jgi:hypothetical protein